MASAETASAQSSEAASAETSEAASNAEKSEASSAEHSMLAGGSGSGRTLWPLASSEAWLGGSETASAEIAEHSHLRVRGKLCGHWQKQKPQNLTHSLVVLAILRLLVIVVE
jgi:hypothetical protein